MTNRILSFLPSPEAAEFHRLKRQRQRIVDVLEALDAPTFDLCDWCVPSLETIDDGLTELIWWVCAEPEPIPLDELDNAGAHVAYELKRIAAELCYAADAIELNERGTP